jgi:hypothetical protein
VARWFTCDNRLAIKCGTIIKDVNANRIWWIGLANWAFGKST